MTGMKSASITIEYAIGTAANKLPPVSTSQDSLPVKEAFVVLFQNTAAGREFIAFSVTSPSE